jgi:tetratricopeptide (TPR) repeat protein
MISLNMKNKLGHNYSYISFTYAKSKQYNEALEYSISALNHIKDVGNDIEDGRVYLNIAICLSQMKWKDKRTNKKLIKTIKKITNIKKKADKYFEKAIEISNMHKNYNTYIPALMNWYIFTKK